MYKITFRDRRGKTQIVYTKEAPEYFLQIFSHVSIDYLLIEKVGENDGIVE